MADNFTLKLKENAKGTDEDSYEEKEVLVPVCTRFEITDVASDSDYEEMGYYEIKVKRI